MGTNEERKSAWDGYRVLSKIRRVGLGLCVLGIVLVPLGFVSVGILVFGVGWYSIILEYWFKCPRCSGGFFRAWGFYDPLTMCCHKCGLLKWTEPPYAEWKPPFSPSNYPVPDIKIARRKTHLTFLTLVLRDDPGAIGLKLDRDGWVSVDELLKRAKRYRIDLLRDDLDEILLNPENSPFESGVAGAVLRFKRNA